MHRQHRFRSVKTTRPSAQLVFLAGAMCLLLGAVTASAGNSERLVDTGRSGQAVAPGPQTLWQKLAELDLVDRENAHIEFETAGGSDHSVRLRLDHAAKLWNSGDPLTAITIVRTLENLGTEIALGITWKRPPAVSKYNTSQIGTADYGTNPDLDWHTGTGNLFIKMTRFQTASSWHVYFSNDNGRTWSEEFSFFTKFAVQHNVSGIVSGDFYYVTYPSTNQRAAVIRRFSTSTGAPDASFGSNEVFSDPAETVDLLELGSNRVDRLYLFSILSDGALKYYWTDDDGGTGSLPWAEVDTGVTDANNYLDVSFAEDHITGYFLYAVYRGGQGQLSVFRQGNFSNSTTLIDQDLYSSVARISAYRNFVMVVYDHSQGGTPKVKYKISYDSGDTWTSGMIDDGSSGDAYYPDVTLRRGGGIVVSYSRIDNGVSVFLKTRDYPSGSAWSSPVAVTDNQRQLYKESEVEFLPEGGPSVISFFNQDQTGQFDQGPMIWRNGFELGTTAGWQ